MLAGHSPSVQVTNTRRGNQSLRGYSPPEPSDPFILLEILPSLILSLRAFVWFFFSFLDIHSFLSVFFVLPWAFLSLRLTNNN